MANRYKNLIYSSAEYTHTYGGFKGIELNAASLISSKSRLAWCENMYKDYDGDGADVIESIPGFRCFARYGKSINAIYYQRSPSASGDHIIVHVENKLMRHPVSDIHKKNAVGVEIATLENKPSFGFEYGKFYYVMDTSSILRIGEDGVCKRIGESNALPYVPTTYVSGKEYEQRNLLTNSFKEEFLVSDPTAYLAATDGIRFTVTDPYLRYCSVSGAQTSVVGEVHIPAYVTIGDTEYKVTEIEDYAFADNTRISSVTVPYGITKIGRRAFAGCTSLTSVVLSDTVSVIGSRAFSGCKRLDSFYLGAGVAEIGDSAFMMTDALTSISYALDSTDLTAIIGRSEIKATTILYNTRYERIKLTFLAHDEVAAIEEVTVDGKAIDFTVYKRDGNTCGATVELDSISSATGIKIVMLGELSGLESDWASDMTTLNTVTPYQAIVSCTTAEVFDGRIFFSGNPSFPNTVFYTERAKLGQDGALYVGRYNYFNDGVGSYKVKAMLAVRDMLAVFKEGDDGSGSIFYHKKESTSVEAVDTIYPVAYVHSGISAVGGCLSFLDDPVFLSPEGLMALNSDSINYQRNVVCRSHNVNYALLTEDLSRASLCEWLGYLVVGLGDTVLLADSRAIFTHPTGAREYEWFMLRGIGRYTGGTTVYRYSSEAYSFLKVHPTLVGKAASYKDVVGLACEDGVKRYYVKEGTLTYRVEPTEEKSGGVFHPATKFVSHGKLLFFATDNGEIAVFNNDMRGVAPKSLKESEDFDEEEYRALMGNKIHPQYYTFDDHAPTYKIKTALDDCGIPHLTKSTVKKSLVIKSRSHVTDAISCEVATDSDDPVEVGKFPSVAMSFDDLSFDNAPWSVSRYSSVSLLENAKRWIEKQLILTSVEYAAPISIYSISYRYVIKGKIKNNA